MYYGFAGSCKLRCTYCVRMGAFVCLELEPWVFPEDVRYLGSEIQ